MTDLEKLVIILEDNPYLDVMYPGDYEKAARSLLAHGVTVRELQKPLAVDDLPGRLKGVVYVETRFNGLNPFPMFIRDVERELLILWEFGRNGQVHCGLKEYGQTYRFWGVLPTEEERKAAEWEK